MEDLEEAVVNVNKFLELLNEKHPVDKKKVSDAHKKLAELNTKLGYGVQAMKHLDELLKIAFQD